MNTSFKTVLLRILETIHFSEDKDEFINEFVENTSMEALGNLIDTLSEKEQDAVEMGFVTAKTPEDLENLTKDYFTKEQKQQAFQEAAQIAVEEWVESLEPTLTDAQKQKLAHLSEEFAQSDQVHMAAKKIG